MLTAALPLVAWRRCSVIGCSRQPIDPSTIYPEGIQG